MADKDHLSLFEEALTQIAIEFENENNIPEFDSWLRDLKYTSATENTITVSAQSKFVIDQLASRGYIDLLKKKLSEISDQEFDIVFDVKTSAKKNTAESAKKASATMLSGKNAAKDVPASAVKKEKHPQLHEAYRFETFVPGENNIFAYNVAFAVSKDPGKSSYNPVLLIGGTGLGKTHLLQSIGNAIHENSEKKVVYVTAEQFTNEYVETIKKRSDESKFRSKYTKSDVLLMDDIHFFSSKEGTQEALFHTFDALYNSNKQIVFTCDRPIHELKGFTDRLRSRFEHGISVEMLVPNYETRKAILLKKVELLHKNVPDDVIDLIAKNVENNVRVLEGALNQIIAYSELLDKKITVDIARDQLRNVFHNPKTFPTETIQRVVANYHNISIPEMKSKSKKKPIADARNIAIYITTQLTENTLSEIGKEFGGRNYSTMISSRQVIEEKIKNDPDFGVTVEKLIREIKDYEKN